MVEPPKMPPHNDIDYKGFLAALEVVKLTQPGLTDFHHALATVFIYARRQGECGLSLSTAAFIENEPFVLVLTNAMVEGAVPLLAATIVKVREHQHKIIVKVREHQHQHGCCDCEEPHAEDKGDV